MPRKSKNNVAERAATTLRAYLEGGQLDTALLKQAATEIVELRSRFARKDGGTDWGGRSQEYRDAIRDVYTRAGLPATIDHALVSRINYRVREALDARVPADELEAAGFSAGNPKKRQTEKRAADAAIGAALSPTVTPAVLIVQANNLLQRAETDDSLAEMTAKERGVCKLALAAIQAHAEALSKRLAG
jgi:hypothetical protein